MPKEDLHTEDKSLNSEKSESKKSKISWDHEEDNCGINPEENPCGDANEY